MCTHQKTTSDSMHCPECGQQTKTAVQVLLAEGWQQLGSMDPENDFSDPFWEDGHAPAEGFTITRIEIGNFISRQPWWKEGDCLPPPGTTLPGREVLKIVAGQWERIHVEK